MDGGDKDAGYTENCAGLAFGGFGGCRNLCVSMQIQKRRILIAYETADDS